MIHSKKTYYSIREVCELTDLEPHVLRYWESEFSNLRPKKNRAGNRAYREKDIELIQQIKHLLYIEQFTIPGARKKLAELKSGAVDEVEPIDHINPEVAEEAPIQAQTVVQECVQESEQKNTQEPIKEVVQEVYQQNLFTQHISPELPHIVKTAIDDLKGVLNILEKSSS